jgi:hypothetical protein
MVIYIKENEIITEKEIDIKTHEELIEKGFQTVKVPDVEIPSDYKHKDFVKEKGVWVYQPNDEEVS